jgi:UDP-N-acetylmuramoyl-L-alanyl-D-glutamate--2,6-diaminopimelate ligase
MRLSWLLASLPGEAAPQRLSSDSSDPLIRGITYDSRSVAPGDLFVALSGSDADGHDYLANAIALGAVALLVEDSEKTRRASDAIPQQIPTIAVSDSRRAMAPIAARFFGDPASEIRLVGITGTNGKTSTAYLVESILAHADIKTGLIGTVEIRYGDHKLRAVNTTPESLDLQRLLRDMRTSKIEAVVMEVSSHGLELGRVSGCRFPVAAITNVTQDHLDFHGTMEAYLESKLRLFRDHLTDDGIAVVNIDDASAQHWLDAARDAGARVIRTTQQPESEAEVRLLDRTVTLSGSRGHVALPGGEIDLALPLLGDFNLENALVACGIAVALGVPHEAIAAGLAGCPQVPGRMELVGAAATDAPTVIVDYAHTPDAVDKLLAAVRPLAEGQLITVFGCGGDRDRAKRPLMASAVAAHSDRIVLTSDNPRTEDPQEILRDVESGLVSSRRVEPGEQGAQRGAYSVVADRRLAIEYAIGLATPRDTVVLAGKGHEDYQIVGRKKLPFDDRDEAAAALAARGRVDT